MAMKKTDQWVVFMCEECIPWKTPYCWRCLRNSECEEAKRNSGANITELLREMNGGGADDDERNHSV